MKNTKMRFVLNKKIDSIRSTVPTGKGRQAFEITETDRDQYTLYEHIGDAVWEIHTFTKEELRTIWIMLTTNE